MISANRYRNTGPVAGAADPYAPSAPPGRPPPGTKLCHVCGGSFPSTALAGHQAKCIRKNVRPAHATAALSFSSGTLSSLPHQQRYDGSSNESLAASSNGGGGGGRAARQRRSLSDMPSVASSTTTSTSSLRSDAAATHYASDSQRYSDRESPRHHRVLRRADQTTAAPAAQMDYPSSVRRTDPKDPSTRVIHRRMEVAPDTYDDEDDDDEEEERRRRRAAALKKQEAAFRSADSFDEDSIQEAVAGDEEDRDPCEYCGRKFAVDRLEKHMAACSKLKKRKVFDTAKARVKGTELEQYALKKQIAGGDSKQKGAKPDPAPKKSNWRVKHENFIRMVRANRNLDAGGSGASQPFVPSEPDPDYVQCEHCLRRFSPVAAERHIPICATNKHKPKPSPSVSAQGGARGGGGTGPAAAGGGGEKERREEAMKKRMGYKPPLPKKKPVAAAPSAPGAGAPASPTRRR
ncbi:hypothetical protein DFJ73DRAFT_854701 [Zopfochytrium polystomum]|nr:hypothetical protein DFJ73DRAFT_854701 [Zopfochytrium polystomum]